MGWAAAAISVAFFLMLVLAGLAIERLAPAQRQPLAASGFNLRYTTVYMLAQSAIVPVISVLTVYIVNALGGGWIPLAASGWRFAACLALYALSVDFLEYLFHRAQHRFPALWAMHSLHHSDTAMNASTTNRHYWAEHGIKMLTIYLAIGLVYQAPPDILAGYALLSYYNVFLHMNIRVGYGRGNYLLNSPQFHRIHHSALPQHYDCNFAALFPVFDLIFGTYRAPAPAEYPPTGIDTGRQPQGLLDAVLWPLRNN